MSQQKQENQEDDTVLLIFLLVSCLVTKIDEWPGELGRWSMENCMDGDGEQEQRVKNVGDLDAKLEVEGEANGLRNVGSGALMAISIPPKPSYLPFYSSLPSSFSLTLPLKPKSRQVLHLSLSLTHTHTLSILISLCFFSISGPSSSSAVSPSSSSAVVFSAGGTGGHIYPAITIADELKITNPNVQIHDSFSNRTRKISFKNPKLLYEDSHDAEDAIYYQDGYNFDGYRLRVELAHGGRGNSSSADHHGSYGDSGSSRAAPKHSDYRVLVTRLPPSASWQDLKDHMRQPGDVLFSQVFCDRGGMTGIVDYAHYKDMKYAVREYDSRQSYSRSHSCDSRRSYSRSPYMSRSPSRSRSYSGRSRSISPKRKYSRPSPSVSGSRFGTYNND